MRSPQLRLSCSVRVGSDGAKGRCFLEAGGFLNSGCIPSMDLELQSIWVFSGMWISWIGSVSALLFTGFAALSGCFILLSLPSCLLQGALSYPSIEAGLPLLLGGRRWRWGVETEEWRQILGDIG